MLVDLFIVGHGRRSCEVDIFVTPRGEVTVRAGHWVDDGSDLTDDELDLVAECLAPDIAELERDARAARAYDDWKASRFD